MTAENLKIGDLVRSKKNQRLLKVVGITPFTIFMDSVDMTRYPTRKMCRKRQFDLFYERLIG